MRLEGWDQSCYCLPFETRRFATLLRVKYFCFWIVRAMAAATRRICSAVKRRR